MVQLISLMEFTLKEGVMVSDQQPKRVHTYQNHTFDSTRWNYYTPRKDDIIIATSYKSGTTWMQNIVLQLIGLALG